MDRDGDALFDLMVQFSSGSISLSNSAMAQAQPLFASERVSDDATCEEIVRVWRDKGYLLDPHSAIGTRAAVKANIDVATPMVTLATAHPAKFPDAIARSGVATTAALPAHLSDLMTLPERFTVLANDLDSVQQHIATTVSV